MTANRPIIDKFIFRGEVKHQQNMSVNRSVQYQKSGFLANIHLVHL